VPNKTASEENAVKALATLVQYGAYRSAPSTPAVKEGGLSREGSRPVRKEKIPTLQISFVRPKDMTIGWQVGAGWALNQLMVPARYSFARGTTFRLVFSNIPGRDALEIYPTLQVYPAHPATDVFFAHSSVPLAVTDEDLDQLESGNLVTKVIYILDPKFQELALAGVETLVEPRLTPGVDPIAEAERRGTIMLVVRIGNKAPE
jgi:hypothetical protein